MSRVALREIALAGVVTAVIAASPLTPNEWGPSILIGLAVAAAFAAWRRWQRPMPATTGEPSDAIAVAPEQLLQGILWVGLGALWLLSFAPTLSWVWGQWTTSVWVNDHGIFMPFIIGYLTWKTLRDDPDLRPASSAWGFGLLGAGLVLSLLDTLAMTRYVGIAGLLLTLPGLALLLLGTRRTRLLAVPMSLSLLMVPVPITLSTHLYLRQITASAVEPLIRSVGVPVFRENTVIHLASGNFIVADACSGFATLYASLAVALVLFFTTRSRWRRMAIVLTAPLLAIAANILRVLALILIAHFVGQWTLDTPLHEATGVAAFLVVLVSLFIVAWEPSHAPGPDAA